MYICLQETNIDGWNNKLLVEVTMYLKEIVPSELSTTIRQYWRGSHMIFGDDRSTHSAWK